MEQPFVTAATLIDDDSERPTIPSLRPRQRPKIRRRVPSTRRARFDAHAEHFFSNAETVPELVPDERHLAEIALLRPTGEDDAERWWVSQRRAKNLRLVMALCAACVALLCAVALR